MTFAAGLAFNLITAIFPILIALIAIAGLIFSSFNPTFQPNLITHIKCFSPTDKSGKCPWACAYYSQQKRRLSRIYRHPYSYLWWLASLRPIEGYFSIVYHTRQRTVVRQNIMALVMLLFFIILSR